MPSSEYYRNVYGAMAEGRVEYQRTSGRGQKGNGFFGRLIRGSIAPMIKSILPYLKDVALDGVGGIVNNLKEGMTVKEASKSQLKRTASTLMNDVAKKLSKKEQSGSGFRRPTRRQIERKRRARKEVKKARTQQRGLFPI